MELTIHRIENRFLPAESGIEGLDVFAKDIVDVVHTEQPAQDPAGCWNFTCISTGS